MERIEFKEEPWQALHDAICAAATTLGHATPQEYLKAASECNMKFPVIELVSELKHLGYTITKI